jgi:hypothetical protein
MNLVDLIILVCSLASPTSCHEQHLLIESHGSLRACAMEAQPYLAQWINEHPGVRIARYRCDWPQHEGEKA